MISLLYKILESSFTHLIKKHLDKILDKKEIPKTEKLSTLSKLKNEQSKRELSTTTKRLQLAVELLFKNQYNHKFPINRVADTLGLKSETEFRHILNGQTEPTFDFLNFFSENYGIDKDWLKYGEKSPFRIGPIQLYATGYLPIIKELKPKKIYLVREDAQTGRTGIVLRLGTWRFKILGKSYHISSKVGGTGQIQIEEFYKFIKELNTLGYSYSIQSKIVSRDIYSKLFSGHLSPKILESFNYNEVKNSYWADDFLDYEHYYPIAKHYEMRYGKEFLKAQMILKYKFSV